MPQRIQPSEPELAALERIASLEKNPAKGGMAASESEPIRNARNVQGSSRARPPMRRMSCSPASAWMTTPAAMKSSALKKACVIRWKSPAPYAPRPTPTNM